jgi:hypothetical protein
MKIKSSGRQQVPALRLQRSISLYDVKFQTADMLSVYLFRQKFYIYFTTYISLVLIIIAFRFPHAVSIWTLWH